MLRAQRRGRRPPLTVLGHSQLGLSLMTLAPCSRVITWVKLGSLMTRRGVLASVGLALMRSSLCSSVPALSVTTLPTMPLLLLHVATAEDASLADFKPVVA